MIIFRNKMKSLNKISKFIIQEAWIMDTAMACGPLVTTNYQHLYCSCGDYNPSNEKLSGFCQSLARF